VDLAWSYRQPGRYAQPVTGLGVGMSWGNPEIVDGQLVLASGQSVRIDPTTPTGVADHKQLDIQLNVLDVPLDAQTEDCVAMRPCAAILSSIDGTIHELDIDGKLAATRDKNGNTAWWSYDAEGRVSSVTAGATQAPKTVDVEYQGDERILLHLPSTVAGVSPVIDMALENHLVTSISQPKADADAKGHAAASLSWTEFGGVMVPSAWTEPTGARTEISYQQVNNLVAVKELVTKDPKTGVILDKPLKVNLNPDGNDARNYSGWPKYHRNTPLPSTGTSDPLVASNDTDYTYQVAIDDGQQTTTRTFDHLHRLLTETVTVNGAPVNTLSHEYLESAGQWPNVPAQYQHPTSIARTVHDPDGHREDRTVTATFGYDTRGRVLSEEGVSTRTDTTYDTDMFDDGDTGFGLPLSTTKTATTGVAAGTVRTETAELTADRTAIATRTTTAQAPGGEVIVTEELHRAYDPATGAVVSERTVSYGTGAPVDRTTRTDRAMIDGIVVITQTAADGAITVTRVDPATGLVIDTTTPDGVTTATDYDLQGRDVRVDSTDAPSATMSYETFAEHGVNRRTTVRESDGYAVRDTADAAGRPVLEEDNLVDGLLSTDGWRVRAAKTYDERGNVASETDAAGLVTTTRHDHADRVVETTAPDGTRRVISYDDAIGVTVTQLHPAGDNTTAEVTTTVTRDDEGRVVRQETSYRDGSPTIVKTWSYTAFGEHESTVEETAGRSIHYSFDAAGVLTGSTIQADGTLTVDAAYRFDGAGNRLGKDISGAGTATTAHTETHDAAGRVLTSTDQLGYTTTFTYDTAGNRVRTDYPDGRSAHAAYGPGNRLLSDWWTNAGDDTRVQERRYGYDTNGNIAAVEATADPDGTRIAHTHAPDGKLLTSTHPDGSVITYTHDNGNRLVSVTDPDGTTTRYERDDKGRIEAVSNGTATMSYQYDQLSRIAAIERRGADGQVDSKTTFETTSGGLTSRQTETDHSGTIVLDEQRSYSGTGLLERTRTTIGDTVPDLESGPLKGVREYTTVHAYDGLDRLAGTTIYAGRPATPAEDATAPQLTSSRYTLSSGAGLESVAGTAADGETRSDRTLDAAGRTATIVETDTDGTTRTIELAWDAADNLTRDTNGIQYQYDIANQLTGWTTADGQHTALEYRIDGTRHQRTDPDGTRTETFATPGQTTSILLERVTTPDGTTTSHATMAGSGPAAITSDGDVTWLLAGHRGDILLTIGQDGVNSRNHYSDYGTPTRSETGPAYQPYGYAGAYTDATGRLLLGIRTLDTTLGQFTSKDPTNLVSRFAYASGDPIQNIDPTGMMSDTWKDVLTGLGDFGGAAIGLIIAGAAVFSVVTAGAATPAVVAAVAGLVLELAATAMTAVLFVDHLRGNTWLSDGARYGLWGASIGAGLAGGASSGFAATKAARAVALANDDRALMAAKLRVDRSKELVATAEDHAEWYRAKYCEFFGLKGAETQFEETMMIELRKNGFVWKTTARSAFSLIAVATPAYASNPWSTPLSERPNSNSGDAPAPGASMESIPRPAQYAGAHRTKGSDAPARGIHELMNE